MILQSLHLLNFGLYGGTHEFNLSPGDDQQHPVILVKGHNGAGKTTFLEAVRLALYGKRALGGRIGQSDYEAHLLRRIHHQAPERHAQIRLEFTSHHAGDNDTYCVTRAWASRGTSVVETLDFTKNGKEVSNIPREEWEHYLEDMIPVGVSQLFFFDGEKIQDIADNNASEGLYDAIRSLLGLDLIDQLRGDLALFKARSGETSTDYDIEAITRDLKGTLDFVVLNEESAAALTAKRNQLAKKSERAQHVFQQEGGSVALDRGALNDSLRDIEIEWKDLLSSLKAIANNRGPFALAPKLTKQFSNEVERVKGTQFEKAVEVFVSAFEKVAKTKDEKSPTWSQDHFSALRSFASTATNADDVVTLSAEPEWINSQFAHVADDRVKATQLSKSLSDLLQRRSLLKEQLKNFRPGAAVDAFQSVREAEFNLGAVETELSQVKAEVERLRALAERLKAERQKALEAQIDTKQVADKTDLATRTQAALANYEQRILQKRLSSLSSHFVEAFNGLVQRKSLVDTVTIEAESFAITLIDQGGARIETDSLSAGERQLFAISMLWALGKTSGRELPMIIDTPLSRLDQLHRESLMSNYLPRASNQVIMLCTDTELTTDIEEMISPFVARTYEIGVIDNGHTTGITENKVMRTASRKAMADAR